MQRLVEGRPRRGDKGWRHAVRLRAVGVLVGQEARALRDVHLRGVAWSAAILLRAVVGRRAREPHACRREVPRGQEALIKGRP